MDARPTVMDLWKQSDGDTDEYQRLMREHGYIIECGCEGMCEHRARALPCGFPTVNVDTSDLADLRRRVEAEGRDEPMGGA